MITENLQIYKDTKILCQLLLSYMPNISKVIRYGEYGKTLSMACDALDLIYIANSDMEKRYKVLIRYLQVLGGIRSRIVLFTETKFLSPKQSTNLIIMIDKVQKQATGWRKSSQYQSYEAKNNIGE